MQPLNLADIGISRRPQTNTRNIIDAANGIKALILVASGANLTEWQSPANNPVAIMTAAGGISVASLIVAGSAQHTPLSGTTVRVVTSNAGGVLGNATTIAGILTWTGAQIFNSTLRVDLATTLQGTLNVTGSATHTTLVGTGTRNVTSSPTGVLGNATTIDGALTWNGATTFASTINVTGTATHATLVGTGTRLVTASPTGVLGSTTSSAFGLVDGTGATNRVALWLDTDTLTSSGSLTFNGTTWALTGAATISSTLLVTGAITNSALAGTGTRIVTASPTGVLSTTAGSTIDGSGATNQVAYWVDADTLTGSANLIFDGSDLTLSRSAASATVISAVKNTSNTSAAHARQTISVAGSAAGNPYLHWIVDGVFEWAMGIHTADANKLKIAKNTSLGISTAITIDTNLKTYLSGALDVTGVVTMSSTLAVTGTTTHTGDIIMTGNGYIRRNTTSPNDNGVIAIFPSTSGSVSDGAVAIFAGNEYTSDAGSIILSAGNVGTGSIFFKTANNSTRLTINNAGLVSTSSDFQSIGQAYLATALIGNITGGLAGQFAVFSHSNFGAGTNYALRQQDTGATSVNAPTGQVVRIRINDSDSGVFSSTGLTIPGTMAVTGNITGTAQIISNKNGGGITSGFLVSSNGAGYAWNETGAPADNRLWDAVAELETLKFRTVNDANNTVSIWMQVHRTGTSIDAVDFPRPVMMQSTLNVTGITTSGIAKIGTWPTNGSFAMFAHSSLGGATDYALLAQNDGATYLNAASGKQIGLNVNNASVITITPANITITGTPPSGTNTGKITAGNLSGTVTTTVTATSAGLLGRTAALVVVDATGQVKSTTSGDALSAGLISESTLPFVAWHEVDAAANQGWWAMGAQASQFRLVAFNDAGGSINDVLTVDRSGATASQITFTPAVRTLAKLTSTVNGGDVDSGISIVSSRPTYSWTETDAPLDQKSWDMTAQGSRLSLRTFNDGGSTTNDIMTVDRAGDVPTVIRLVRNVSTLESLITAASTGSRVGFRIPPGTAPAAPTNGDVWYDSGTHQIMVRLNGVNRRLLDVP